METEANKVFDHLSGVDVLDISMLMYEQCVRLLGQNGELDPVNTKHSFSKCIHTN
jgi:hypothetical protein